MYGEQFTQLLALIQRANSIDVDNIDFSRSKVIGGPTCSISAYRSTGEPLSSPDKQSRVPCFSQICWILKVIARRQIRSCSMEKTNGFTLRGFRVS